MALVYPLTPTCSNSYQTSKRELFTVWMKSLIIHGNGCTVFDSKGEIIYRVDNYDRRCRKEVYLMDLQGKVLFSIRRKRLMFLGHWDGYKWIDGSHQERPWFRVRNRYNIFRREMSYRVIFGNVMDNENIYNIICCEGKSTIKIVDSHGELVAQVRPKETSSGVVLGDDVLSLVVESQIDHSLVMALVIVYGLITNKM